MPSWRSASRALSAGRGQWWRNAPVSASETSIPAGVCRTKSRPCSSGAWIAAGILAGAY